MISPFAASDPYEQLISQMIQLESQPQLDLKSQRKDEESFKDVLSSFDSTLSSLNTVLTSFTDLFASPFDARTATTGTGATFGVSATDSAAYGTHSLQVQRLASADARVSAQYTDAGTSLRSFFDTNGAQTFSIDVAQPTDEDPNARLAVSVTVDPTGATDGEILEEVQQAIDDAFGEAIAAGDLDGKHRPTVSVIHELSGTSRLSLRSADTGYAGRFEFSDSAGGLLDALQVTRSAVVGSTTTTATSASVTGTPPSFPLIIDGSNQDFSVEIDGAQQDFSLAPGTYLNADDLAAALNDVFGSDVEASVVDGALQLTTTATGTTASLRVLDSPATTALGFTAMSAPVYGTESAAIDESGGGMLLEVGTSEATSSLNSKFKLNGLTFYRSANEVSDALDGVTLSFDAVGETSTAFTIEPDSEGIVGEINSFIAKYNAVLGFIEQETMVDAETGERGQLADDYSARSLRYDLRATAALQIAGVFDSLDDLGIEINDDGTLSLADQVKLEEAIAADPSALKEFFAGEDGLGARLQTHLDRFLGTDGFIESRQDAADARIKQLDRRIEQWDERLERREELLRSQFLELQEVAALVDGQQSYLNAFLYSY